MFLLLGISGKVKDCGEAPSSACPVCGSVGVLRVCNKYMTPTVFFIPTFRLKSSYFATCAHCASVMEVDKDKGRALARGQEVTLRPGDLRVVQDNAVPLCHHCGRRVPEGSAFCNSCGSRLV